MPIHPLPQFEADVAAHLAEEDRKAYEALKAPKTVVVRFGSMKMVGEFAYSGTVKPGCGSKLVVRTFRGTELGEMLTSTCPNSGCSKSVSRQDMLRYIENSGGSDYPFYTEGKVVRIATGEDLDRQSKLEQSKHALRLEAREIVEKLGLPVKVIEVEPVLGGESLTVFTMSEERIELRELARELGHRHRVRVELRGVGARDEARLTADYEKCGQYCCCKNFLKVLRPVSMKSAKVQKATLDPLKISGRCGRLMCCLRYEDETYEDLAKRLPRRKSRVGTPEGDGIVLETQILTQLALVLLDEPGSDGKERRVAIAVEELTPPTSATGPAPRALPAEGGNREGAREGTRQPPRDVPREGGREGRREGQREGQREGPREGQREGPREGQRESGGRERARDSGRGGQPRAGGRGQGGGNGGGAPAAGAPGNAGGPVPPGAGQQSPGSSPGKGSRSDRDREIDELLGGDIVDDDLPRGGGGGGGRRGPRRDGGGGPRRDGGGSGGGGGGPVSGG